MKNKKELLIDFEEYIGLIGDIQMILIDFSYNEDKGQIIYELKSNLINSEQKPYIKIDKKLHLILIEINSYFSYERDLVLGLEKSIISLKSKSKCIEYEIIKNRTTFGDKYHIEIRCPNNEIIDEILRHSNYLIRLIDNANGILDYHHHVGTKNV